jgi:hypothetical protein
MIYSFKQDSYPLRVSFCKTDILLIEALKIVFPPNSGMSGTSLSCATIDGNFDSNSPSCIGGNFADGKYYVIV